MREVKPYTVWRHFKGTRALVITTAKHSEQERILLYITVWIIKEKLTIQMVFMQDHLRCFYQKLIMKNIQK